MAAAIGAARSAIGLLATVEADVGPFVKGMEKSGKSAKKAGSEGTGAFEMFNDMAKKVLPAIAAIGGAFLAALAPSELFRSLLSTVIQIYGTFVDQIIASLQPAWQPFLDFLVKISTDVIPVLLPHLTKLAETIGPVLTAAFEQLIPQMIEVAERIGPILVRVLSDPAFLEALGSIVENLGEIAIILAAFVIPVGIEAFGIAIRALGAAAQFARDPVKGLAVAMDDLIRSLTEGFGIINSFKDMAKGEFEWPKFGLESFDPNELFRRLFGGG